FVCILISESTVFFFFFFTASTTTKIYTLSLHDALPIYDFATAHSRAVTDAFSVIAYSKGLASLGMATLSVRTSKAICKALGRLCSSCYLAGKLMSTGNTSLAGHWLKKCAFESDARRWVCLILAPRVLLCKSV